MGAFWARVKRLPWVRLFAGAAAGGAALLATFIMRLLGLGIFLPEVALDFVITRIPGSIETVFISTLGEGAKGLGVVTALVAVEVAFGLGALVFRRVQTLVRWRYGVILLYTLATAAIVLLVVLPLLGAGIAGSQTDAGVVLSSLSQLVGGWIYAAVMDYLFVDVAAQHPEGFSPSRRQFLVGAVAALGALSVAFVTFSTTVVEPARLVYGSLQELLSQEVTPTDQFYVMTKNFIDPVVDASTWSLTVDGLVSTPLSLGYADLQARISSGVLPAAGEYATMECVSNEVGGNLIGTARWDGVRLADVLTAAGIESAADWVEFTSVDGYTVAIPRAQAMDPATLVVLEMNGAPLPGAHGGPVRVVVPGKYGMFSAKWLNRITAVQGEVLGFWQQKGWTDDGHIATEALIAIPSPGSVISGTVTIGGFAVSAADGISKVEVSTDGGATWVEAQLRAPKDPKLTWVLWTYDWTPIQGGAYNILARAYDLNGVRQTASVAPPFPNGATGYDSVSLLVS